MNQIFLRECHRCLLQESLLMFEDMRGPKGIRFCFCFLRQCYKCKGADFGEEVGSVCIKWSGNRIQLLRKRDCFEVNFLEISKVTYSTILCTVKTYYAAAAAAAKSLQSCLTLCEPIDSSPPDSPVPGILQARTLEWVAISFSNAWKWKVKMKLLSHVWLFATPWTAAQQAPPPMGFSRQEYWSETYYMFPHFIQFCP